MAPERREVGVDPKPPGREVVRHLEQRLQLVHRLVRLTRDGVDARELVHEIGTHVPVARHGHQRHRPISFPHGVCLPAQVGEHQAEEDASLRIVRGCLERFGVAGPPRIGVDACLVQIPAEVIHLRGHPAPGALIVVIGPRREAQQELLLRLVERPAEVPIVTKRGNERRGLDLCGCRANHRLCARQVALA